MDKLLIPTKYKLEPWQVDTIKIMLSDDKRVLMFPRKRYGKITIMNEVVRQKFYKNIKQLMEVLHSDHPNDKDIVQGLLGEMNETEVLLMRELLTRAGKSFYVRSKEG